MNGWKKTRKNQRRLRSVLVATVAVALCALTLLLPFEALYPNTSGNRFYGLSNASKQYLQGISEDVEIVYYSVGGKLQADRGLYRFVRRVSAQNDHIRLRVEDPKKTGSDAADQSIEIRTAEDSKRLEKKDLVYYYSASVGKLSVEEYDQTVEMLGRITSAMQSATDQQEYQQLYQMYQSYMTYYGPSQMSGYNMSEKAVISAIRNFLAERSPKLYAYGSFNSLLRAELEYAGYTVTVLNTIDPIPNDCEALYLGLVQDVTEQESGVLAAYLEGGGKLFLTTDYSIGLPTNLSNLLSTYGLRFGTEQNYLCVITASQDSSSYTPTTAFTVTAVSHSVTDGLSSAVTGNSHWMGYAETEGVTVSTLLQTPTETYCVTANNALLGTGSFPVSLLAEKEQGAVLWLSMSVDSMSNSSSGGANFTFVKQGFDYLTQYSGTPMTGISDTKIPSTYLGVKNLTVTVWFLAFILVIPVTVFTVGAVRAYKRKKRSEQKQ